MHNPLKNFDYNFFKLKTNDTEPEKVLNILEEIIDSTQSNVSFQQQASIFLNDEKDNLKEYINDMILHYIYKRVFNDSLLLYSEFKDEEQFIEEFINNFDEKYINNIIEKNKIEELALDMFNLVQAPKNSDLKSWSKRLTEYSTNESETSCYICGRNTEKKEKKNNIFLDEFLDFKDNPNYSNMSREFFNLFNMFKIKKNTNNRNKFIDRVFKIFYKYNSFEYFKREYKDAHMKFNGNSMEIEHNFPKNWGGAKNLDNLFVSCHKCNQDKKDITFYSEYSISRFFSNKKDMQEAGKSLRSKLGSEALLSLKMKQKFKCINEDCNNHFNSFKDFYIIKIDNQKGFYFSNLQIECKNCIESKNGSKIERYGESEFYNEFCIKLENKEVK